MIFVIVEIKEYNEKKIEMDLLKMDFCLYDLVLIRSDDV